MSEDIKNADEGILRLGLLGCSDIAPNAVIKPSRNLPEVEIVACAARDEARAVKYAKKYGIPRVHATYEALIADPEIDAVYISLPNSLHCKWALAAFDAGKHVLCEKPLANNAEEVQQMAAGAQKNGVLLFEAFHWMYHPMAARIKELVAKEIGKVKHVTAILNIPIFRGTDIRYNYSLGGGALMDTGCYCASAIRWILDEELEVVSANCKTAYPHVDQDVTAQLVAPSGATATLQCSIFSIIPDISMKIEGENGNSICVINWVAPHMLYNLVKIADSMGNWREEKFSRSVSTYQYQLKAFAAAIKSGDFNIPTDARFSLGNQSLIDSVYTKLGLPVRGTPVAADPESASPAKQESEAEATQSS